MWGVYGVGRISNLHVTLKSHYHQGQGPASLGEQWSIRACANRLGHHRHVPPVQLEEECVNPQRT